MELTRLIKEDMRPALGVTEPGAIAFSVAKAKSYTNGEVKKVKVYGEERYVDYDSRKRIGIAISKLGASKAVSVGAYAFALSELDKR